MSSLFLKAQNTFTTFVRFKGYRHSGAVIYPGGIKYYPRTPDEKDPDIIPSKLFRLEMTKPFKGIPRNLRHTLALMGLKEPSKEDKHPAKVSIVKNIPEVNKRLWSIKHLIRITPITYPHGEPTADDINHTTLKSNGECVVIKRVGLEPLIEARENFENRPVKLTGHFLERDARKKWRDGWSGGF